MLDLGSLRKEIEAEQARFEKLGSTNEDANSYWNDIFRGLPEAQAEERLFAGRSLTADERQFVLELLSAGKPKPSGEYGY